MSSLGTIRLGSTTALTGSVLCLTSIGLALLAVRMEWIDFRTASMMVRLALQASVVLLILSVLVALIGWRRPSALFKAGLAILLLLGPLVLARMNMPAGSALFASPGPPPPGSAQRGPGPINDITTDTSNPPAFDTLTALQAEDNENMAYGGQQTAKAQQALYPDIQPVRTLLAPAEALDQAADVAVDMGWTIVAKDTGSGRLEATARTPFFGLTDDVVVRIAANGDGSLVDIRSRSRIGRGDRGKNAERIREFTARFQR